MTYGSVFSGAGLGDFGFELAGFECRWQIENNIYCRKILNLRWPNVKRYGDIKKVKTESLEKVDLVTGGFPCQPFSVAGKRVGEDDDRNLWPQMFRVIKDLKPRWVVAENVPGIIPLYLDTVLSDLENADYKCWSFVFSAHSLGAWHKRERLWIVANAQNFRIQRMRPYRKQKPNKNVRETLSLCKSKIVSNSLLRRHNTQKGKVQTRRNSIIYKDWWATEPNVGRVVNGCANRVDRLKALGNGQTPCSTFLIGKVILDKEVRIWYT